MTSHDNGRDAAHRAGAARADQPHEESLHTENGRHLLRLERRFDHPPEKVWRAVTEPRQLSQWFPATVQFDLESGSTVLFDMGDGAEPTPDGTVTVVEAPRTFAFTWHGEVLRFDLHPDGAGCLLVFTHTFDDRAGAASFCSGWSMCLNALADVVAGVPVTHVHPSAELHDGFVARFGLDEPSVEHVDGHWRVRVERQLTAPAADAWVLIGTETPVGAAGDVVDRQPEQVLDYSWQAPTGSTGRIRWELGPGTGHGARLIVTQTGPAADAVARDAAAAWWPDRVARLAADLRGAPATAR